MPAYLKSILTGVCLSIPVADSVPALGTWQGIYICEHRRALHRRTAAVSLCILSEINALFTMQRRRKAGFTNRMS